MSRFPLPSEHRLEELIRESFELSAGPDMSRLNQLEQRLIRKLPAPQTRKKMNTLPWWFVLLLTGGLAAATWWAGERIMNRDNRNSETPGPVETEQLERNNGSDENNSENASQVQEPEAFIERESPLIYQREGM